MNQHHAIVKKYVIPILVSLALTPVATTVSAQSPATRTDSVLLSERREGDCLVRRYLVKERDDADYSIRYRISSAKLNTSLDGNGPVLSELGDLVEGLLADSLAQVARVSITGYASPDGPAALNRTLARQRMQDFKSYVDRRYGFSRKYDVRTGSEVVPWSEIRGAVASSSIPDRQRVLEIIDDGSSPADKQTALKRMPAVWEYLAANILPPLRRVAVEIDYGQGAIVEQRVRMAPQPTPEVVIVTEESAPCPPCDPCNPCQDPCYDDLMQSGSLGVIVAMPYSDVDF